MQSYQLPSIEYLKLRFHLAAQLESYLPHWKGSLLRGAFGHALRRTVCTMKPGLECVNCMLRDQCAYTRLFETFVTGTPPPFINGLHSSPRPFIYEPSDKNQTYKPGDILWFDLALIGSSVLYLPYVIFAVYQMGKIGFGRNRYPFELKLAFCQQCPSDIEPIEQKNATPNNSDNHHDWQLIYDGETQQILFNPQPLLLQQNGPPELPTDKIKLTFQTETRIVFGKALAMEFSFRQLVFKMLRRVLELAYFYAPEQDVNWEFRDLLEAADNIAITNSNIRWHDQTRYSNRQNRKHKLGGFVGDIILKGNLSPFWNLLKYSQVVHVGKGATFGLGKIEIAHG